MSSYAFSPSIGGIESVSAALANEFVVAGHEVKLITQTRETDTIDWPFPVIRQPRPSELLRLMRWCDIFFQNNISLQSLWAGLLLFKPIVITHQTWIGGGNNISWQGKLKRFLCRFVAKNVAISRAIADEIDPSAEVIGNPYRDDIFQITPGVQRENRLVYLGRLVSDKGVDLLLHAIKTLEKEDLWLSLTVIGSGPEEESLRALSSSLQIASRVAIVGPKSGEELARLLSAHEIMAVPSRWAEPFGVVALEGIACGCVVIGSDAGGLKDAIGPCGVTFKNGDADSLSEALRKVVVDAALRKTLQAAAPAHLLHFQRRTVAARYLHLFSQVKNATHQP